MLVAYAHLAAFKAKVRLLENLLNELVPWPKGPILGKNRVRRNLPNPFELLAKLSGFADYPAVLKRDAQQPENPIEVENLVPRLRALYPALPDELANTVIERLRLPTTETLLAQRKPKPPAEPTWTTPPKHFYRGVAGGMPAMEEGDMNGYLQEDIIGVVDRITEHLGDFHDNLFFAIGCVIWQALARPRYVLTATQDRPKLIHRAWPDLTGITFAEFLAEPHPRAHGARHLPEFPTYRDVFWQVVSNAANDFVDDAVEALHGRATPAIPEGLLAAARQFTWRALTAYLTEQALKARGGDSLWSLLQLRPSKHGGLIRYRNTRKDFSLGEKDYEGPEDGLALTRVHKPLPGGLTASILSRRIYTEYSEEFDFVAIELVVRTPEGDNIGFVSGRAYCAQDGGATGWDFFCAADALDQQSADMAHMLVRGDVGSTSLFDDGSILHITGWEMAEAYQGQGLGAEALQAYLRRANEVIDNLAAVYLEITPYQFPGLSLDKMPPQYVRAQREATGKLDDYVENLCLGDDFDRLTDGETVYISTRYVDSERTEEQGRALTREYLAEAEKLWSSHGASVTDGSS